MHSLGKRIFLSLLSFSIVVLIWNSLVTRIIEKKYADSLSDVVLTLLGISSLFIFPFIMSRILYREPDIIIELRPNMVTKEHHEVIERLGAIEAERAALLARKNALETPGSESSKYIALANERKS